LKLRETGLLFCAFAACALLAATLVARDLERPGLYYDEVIQAVPAADFLRRDARPSQVPGTYSVRLLGGWFPVMTQPYMGALKSQLLIPIFFAADASPASLRLTTLCWSLIGVLLIMLWTRPVLGLPAAVIAGALLASDPSLLFVSRHDWGSFSLALLLRGAALLLLTYGWTRRSLPQLLAGGLCAGLGLYNKIDFAVPLAASLLALLVANPRIAREALRLRRGPLLATLGATALGAAPVLAALGGALTAAERAARAALRPDSPDWGEKLQTLVAMLDGSYFQRLMLSGGRFADLAAVEGAAASPLLVAFLASALVLVVTLVHDGRRGAWHRGNAFVLVAALLTLLGLALTPRATRIHHGLNLYPYPHLVIAAAALELWRRATRRVRLQRAGVALALAAILAGAVRADLATFATLRASGGKGRWSDANIAFARELGAQPEQATLSLDWGFDGPLRFVAPELDGREPFWQLRGREQQTSGLPIGTPEHTYLVFAPRFAVFPYGDALLAAVAALPGEAVRVRAHRDREGDIAFHSIRFTRPHQLVYHSGRFEVRWR
jgi:hypothetical protein